MRWFTRQLHEGNLPDDAWDAALTQYRDHLAMLLPRLPASLRSLAETDRHDAVFTQVTIGPASALRTLSLVGGDLQQGYNALTIACRNAVLVGTSDDEFSEWVRNPETTVLYDELDMRREGEHEHRFLLWPHGEFAVTFSDADIVVAPASSEEYRAAEGRVEITRYA